MHTSMIFLLPMYLYKWFKFEQLRLLLFVSVLIGIIVDPVSIIAKIPGLSNYIPEDVYFKIVFYSDQEGESSSKRYIITYIFLLFISLYYYRKRFKKYNDPNLSNLVILYVIIAVINYKNSDVFKRMSNLSQYIAVIDMIPFLRMNINNEEKYLKLLFVCFYFLANIKMTLVRTVMGEYASSYCDNSIFNLLTYNLFDYLTYKYRG